MIVQQPLGPFGSRGTRDTVKGVDNPLLREILRSIPAQQADYGAWWGTSRGQALYGAISHRIGVPLRRIVQNTYDFTFEPADVANTAVTSLSPDFVRFAVIHANDSWAYLYAVLKRELTAQAGRFFRADPEHIVSARGMYLWDGPTVPIGHAIELTLDRLKPVTDLGWHAPLRESVFYFVEHGHGRLSHLFTESTRAIELTGLGLSRVQILAIGNVVLGSRPDHGTNSLLGGFLRDENWDPSVSLPHRRALSKFALRINGNLDVPTRAPIWAS